MGDPKRGKIVSKFIKKNFRNVARILSVADGNFVLAKELYDEYKKDKKKRSISPSIVVIDPIITSINVKRMKGSEIAVYKKEFKADSDLECDLIVGLHPDSATGEIIDFAIRKRMQCVVIPCCILGKYGDEYSKQNNHCTLSGWIDILQRRLEKSNFQVSIIQLKFSGANYAIKAIPKK